MECSSMFFPIQVKQELPDDGYEIGNHPGGFFGHHPFLAPPPLPGHGIKPSEPGLLDHQSPRIGLPQAPSTVDSRGIINSGNSGLYASNTVNSNNNSNLVKSKPKTKKKKIKQEEPEMNVLGRQMKQEKITDTFKVRKKVDRFNGMSEEEVVKRTLPDHLALDLDIVIVGINPGLYAAFKGHHYAGPGNHFWKCLYLSGLIPDPMTADDDFRLIEYGIGFTNIVNRTTRGSADLSRKEIREGAQILQEKLQKYKPKIAVFNGKGIYEVFSGRKNFDFGKQPEPIEGTNTLIYVMPSSSARCAQLPRAVDKVPFYVALKKLREHLCGRLPVLRDSEVCFPDVKLKVESGEDNNGRTDEMDGGGGGGGHDDHNSGDVNQINQRNSGITTDEDIYRRPAVNVPHAQRNFHQHPLGRAALAAAAACGGYMEETLARQEKSQKSSSSSSNVDMPSKKKAKKKKGDDDEDNESHHHQQQHHLMQNMKCEPDLEETSHQQNGVHNGRNSPQSQRSSNDYSRHHSQLQRLSPHPMSNYCPPGYGNHMPPSPGESYGSPFHHPHIKQEKIDILDSNGRLNSPNTPGSPTSSLLAGYPSSVGCLYNGVGGNGANGGYVGQSQTSSYFGGPPSPYGSYHHLSPHLHHGALNSPQDLFGSLSPPVSSASSSSRENGLRHHQSTMSSSSSSSQHESQYFTSNATTARGSPYSPLGSPVGCKDSSAVTAFHHYPSPPAYHPHLHHLQPPPSAAQYCGPDGSPPPSIYDHQSAPPLYANLETVKIKHERLDPTYDNY